MTKQEAALLKKGDLVVYKNTASKYQGLVFEIESIELKGYRGHFYYATLVQPGFSNSFRMEKCDTRILKRYES